MSEPDTNFILLVKWFFLVQTVQSIKTELHCVSTVLRPHRIKTLEQCNLWASYITSFLCTECLNAMESLLVVYPDNDLWAFAVLTWTLPCYCCSRCCCCCCLLIIAFWKCLQHTTLHIFVPYDAVLTSIIALVNLTHLYITLFCFLLYCTCILLHYIQT